MPNQLRLVALAAAAVIVVGCGGDTRGPTLTGAGATFAMPLISLWSRVYQGETGAWVNYDSMVPAGAARPPFSGR